MLPRNDIIITFDDDVLYDENCIKKLYENYLVYPNCVICGRAHYITFKNNRMIEKYKNWIKGAYYKKPSFNLFQTGVGAVLYFPGCFYKDILDEELFMKISDSTDDIWFWAMSVLNDTKIKIVDGAPRKLNTMPSSSIGLWMDNLSGQNDKNIESIIKTYPEIMGKLKKKKISRFFAIFKTEKYLRINLCYFKIKIKI